MEKYNKLLSNITKLIEKGLFNSKDLKKEVENALKFKMEIIGNKLNFVSREEFEVQKKLIEKLQKELKKLINEDRPNIIAAIAEARSHGDLSENAEYQYAKEQQSLIEGKIQELESTSGLAEIIDVSQLSGKKIKFGATIEIEDNDTGSKSKYQIVGEYESDINNKKLSINSPLARGLIGKTKDDIVEVVSPKGTKSYSVLSVKFI